MTKPQDQKKENSRKRETEKRRNFLLETAVTAFMEKGYHQTGIRDIAKRAGVSLGNLYNHFRSKEAVLIEIARLEADELSGFEGILTSAASPIDRLQKFARSYLAYNCKSENVLLAIEITSEAIRNPNIAKIYSNNRDKMISTLADCLKEASAENEIASVRIPLVSAHFILTLIEAEGQRICFDNRSATPQDTDYIWEMLYYGIGGRDLRFPSSEN